MKIRPFKWKCVILQRKIVPKHLHQNNNSSIEADMKVEINKKRLEYLLALVVGLGFTVANLLF